MYKFSGQNPHEMDMPLKKKMLLYLPLMLLILLWFIGIKNRGDPDQFDAMRQALDLYEFQLKEMRDELEHSRRMCKKDCQVWDSMLPVIYVITPTYARPEQKAELTRLSHTLMLVPNLYWIVVEDAKAKTSLVESLLATTRLNYTHLSAETPVVWKKTNQEPHWKKPRGVIQRNTGIWWLRKHLNKNEHKGVVYFGDDDNTYGLELFEEMRWTRGVSVWPVGLAGGLMVEKPILSSSTGRVVGWNSVWKPSRPFPVDMAGFAINLGLLLKHPKAEFSFKLGGGLQESEILRQLITIDKLEPLADNCTKVYVWHTRTEAVNLHSEYKLKAKYGKRSDDGIIV